MSIRSESRLTAWLPGLRLLTSYDRSWWRHDLTAGLVVTLVLIPSAVAYADLAKCPPIAGLYAALAGMVTFALLTSSRHVIVGPDAAVAILVGAAVGPLSNGDVGQTVVLSSWLALLVALILLLAMTILCRGYWNGPAVYRKPRDSPSPWALPALPSSPHCAGGGRRSPEPL